MNSIQLRKQTFDTLRDYKAQRQIGAGRRITWDDLFLGMLKELSKRGKSKAEKADPNHHPDPERPTQGIP